MDIQLTKLRRWLILFNVCVSIFMSTLDGSIVNIALPVISKELAANISSVQWVVTSYLLTISVLLLIWGKISDLYGKKKIFAFGFIIFTAGSALCGFSTSLGMLVFARILQAVGASAMMALSQGIVISTFPSSERGKALGITGTVVALGSLVGPSLGGVLVHIAGWQSIFYINIPIGILGMILTFAIIPEIHEKPEFTAFDYKGAVMFMVSVVFLFLGLLLWQEGVLSPGVAVPLILISIGVLALFVRFEARIEHPLINLSLFKNRIFSLGLASAYLAFVAIFATNMFIPFYLQYVLNLNTLSAGLIMSFFPIASALVAPFSGWLSDKISYRPLTVIGLAMNTATLIIVSTVNASTSHMVIMLLMALLGVGGAIFQSPNNSSVMGAVPRNQLGVAGGINALFRNLGMVSGITLSVMLFSFSTKMDINKISSSAGSIDNTLFLKGFKIVILSAALAYFTALMISLIRVVAKGPAAAKTDANGP